MWQLRDNVHVIRPPWYHRWYTNPAMGEACWNDKEQWTAAIDVAAPIDAASKPVLYTQNAYIDWLPKNRFLRTTGIFGSIVVNAVRTGFTTVVASWVHNQSFYDGGGELLAFLAAVTTYALVSVILWITLGYGGSAISSDTNIVLDVDASKSFCSEYLRGMPGMPYEQNDCESSLSFSPLISLEFDNTLLAPTQTMYCVKQILCLTTGPRKSKLN